MAIDIRAKLLCNDQYEVISGSISDDYIQGTGVITTKGSCVLNGAVKLNQGDRIWFTYAKYYKDVEVTREIPRSLLVRSSFYDPLRGTTTIDMGCPLYYRKDTEVLPADKFFKLSDSLNLDENGDPLPENTNVITSRIVWTSIVKDAWGALGFSLPSIPIILDRCSFSIEEYEFTQPYLSAISDFYISVSNVAYYDWEEGSPSFINLSNPGGGDAPLLSNSKIIDISPSQFGELEATSVVVDFSYLKLKVPEGEEVVCDVGITPEDLLTTWSVDSTKSINKGNVTIAYTDPTTQLPNTKSYSTLETSYEEVINRYAKIDPSGGPIVFIDSEYIPTDGAEYKELVFQRKMREETSSVTQIGGYISEALSNGFDVGNTTLETESVETFEYDNLGNQIGSTLTRTASSVEIGGSVGLTFVYPDPNNPGFNQLVELPNITTEKEKIVTRNYTYGNTTKTVVTRYGSWFRTIPGQQSIAAARDSFTEASQVTEYLQAIAGSETKTMLDTTVTVSTTGGQVDGTVSSKDLANAELAADTGDPDNGYKTESTAESELISGYTGDSLLIRRFSVPLSPDDGFIAKPVPGSNPTTYCYSSTQSLAPGLAQDYGETQNRLLLGNRNGMNVQIAPEDMPTRPFSPVMLLLERKPGDSNRIYAKYYTNGATWTFDSGGLICSFDALYWGTAGK
jgi:hypothetical protein